MRKYIIERDIPGIGGKHSADYRDAARTSNAALAELGPQIQWQESYVSGDKTFCVYLAANEDIIHQHARLSGFPASRITEVKRMIDPTTASAVVRLRA